jgi:hypothetical protein
MLVPLIVPIETLFTGAFWGGTAGFAVWLSVMIAVTEFPRAPVFGLMLVIPPVIDAPGRIVRGDVKRKPAPTS